jgi:hypothetical protein
MNKKLYHHLIEEADYGQIARLKMYLDSEKAEAEAEVNRLKNLYHPNLLFYILTTNSKNEPEICTI